MQQIKATNLFSKLSSKVTPSKIITSIILATIVCAALITPIHAQLTPARDLTGTWTSRVSGIYYDMDPSEGTMRMDDITGTFKMEITQQGSDLSIVFYTYPTSWKTNQAYYDEWGMSGVPPVNGGSILFYGTISGASFTADEYPASSLTKEHLSGTFTTDIITATLTGLLYTSDTNGIIVLRDGSSATVPPIATIAPTATPPPTPALPTSDNLGSISQVQGSAHFADSGSAVTPQSTMGTGAEIQTGNNSMVSFNYPDLGGNITLGPNSDAAWVYMQPQTDWNTGKVSYTVVPSPATGKVPFEEGLEADEFGQIGITLPIEVGIGILIIGETLPVALTGAAIVEGTMLLGTGIAYVHEQLSPQEGTCNVKPIQVPQGLIMGSGTEYIVTVDSAGSTTIQVIDGSVIFVDQYTNSSITVAANQVLTLPEGGQTGFTVQDLQSDVSAFDASSINQWWIETAATPTPTIATITPTPTRVSEADNGDKGILSNPMILAAIIVVVIVVIVIVLALVTRKKQSRKTKAANQNAPPPAIYETPKTQPVQTSTAQPKPIFCPNCGNQLLDTKGSCPFCNTDLNQWYANNKK